MDWQLKTNSPVFGFRTLYTDEFHELDPALKVTLCDFLAVLKFSNLLNPNRVMITFWLILCCFDIDWWISIYLAHCLHFIGRLSGAVCQTVCQTVCQQPWSKKMRGDRSTRGPRLFFWSQSLDWRHTGADWWKATSGRSRVAKCM